MANLHLCSYSLIASIGGFLFGYDTGIISAATLLLKHRFELSILWQELIVSSTLASAMIFSFFGSYLNKYFGRKSLIMIASFFYALGSTILWFALSKYDLLFGRLIVGVAIGLSSLTIPIYIAEISPESIRGRLVALYTALLTGGQFVACLVSLAFSSDTKNGWRPMLGIAVIPSLLQFFLLFYTPESPRWLVLNNKLDQAKKVLEKLFGDRSLAQEEYQQILEYNKQNEYSNDSYDHLAKIFHDTSTRRALYLGCGLQMLQQICGINTIMYYSATIISLSGISDASTAIKMASITAVINFISTLIGLSTIDKFGRRMLTLLSLSGIFLTTLLLSMIFGYGIMNSPSVLEKNFSFNNQGCSNFRNCESCIKSPNCGFCYNHFINETKILGYCIFEFASSPKEISNPCSVASDKAEELLTWTKSFCPNDYVLLTFLFICFYLFTFSFGMGLIPWAINSEIYPLWARSTCNSLATVTNWSFNLIVSITFLSISRAITLSGTFLIYSCCSLFGFILLKIYMPETNQKSLEEINLLFETSALNIYHRISEAPKYLKVKGGIPEIEDDVSDSD